MLFLLREPEMLLALALSLLVAIVAHSVVQAAVARSVGDRAPAATGRLNPDPRRHFEPFGVIAMLLAGVGWNKPVPFQEPRFRGSRGRFTLAVLSGPLTNLVLATLGLVALKLLDQGGFASTERFLVADQDGIGFAELLAYQFAVTNAAVAALTILPLPPLDGARLLWVYAPRTLGWQNARYQLEERNIGLGISVLLMLPLFGPGLLLRLTLALAEAFLDPVANALGLVVV